MLKRLNPLRKSLLLALVFAAAGTASAQYAIDWFSIDGGGLAGSSVSSGGNYTLEGTIGQADTTLMSGGPYQLQGGFWAIGFGPARNAGDENWSLYE